ncbi:MAG TPA: lipopolysaccharide assembly protein LapA domain-containing protein [Bacillales bacterium]
MRGQWGLLLGLVFALIVAIFAVINVEPVTVDYLFGTARWPLVIVILASALLGALVVGAVGIFRVIRLRWENRRLIKKNRQLEAELQKFEERTPETDGPAQLDSGMNPEEGGAKVEKNEHPDQENHPENKKEDSTKSS